MRKQLFLSLLAIISLFTLQLNAQQTIYEVGRGAAKSFEVDAWDFELICTDPFYTSIIDSANAEQFYLYWFNDLKPFTAVSIKEIPDMLNHTQIDIDIIFFDLDDADDSVYLYTSNDTTNWVLRDKWRQSSTIVNDKATFTNTNHSFVKVELRATAQSGGSYYYFSDFKATGDGIKPPVGISTRSLNSFKIYSFDNEINVRSADNLEYSVSVLTINGQVVYNDIAHGNRVIELNAPKGIYIVTILSDKGNLNQKIVIE